MPRRGGRVMRRVKVRVAGGTRVSGSEARSMRREAVAEGLVDAPALAPLAGAPRSVRRAMASLEGRGMADLSAMPAEVRAMVPKRVREAMQIVEAYVAELEKGG